MDKAILKTLSDNDKEMISYLYAHRNDDIWQRFKDKRAIQRAKEGKVMNAISIEYHLDYTTITAVCREKGVITGAKQVRHWTRREKKALENGSPKSWFTPIATPDFTALAKDFLASKHNVVQIDTNAPEFIGLDATKIIDGFKYKHGVKTIERNGQLFLCRK